MIFLAIGYVKELDEPVSFMDKIRYYFLNEIEVEKFDGNFIFRLPICEKNMEKKYEKIVEKLLLYLKKYRIKSVIFSDNLSNKGESSIIFRDEFYKRNFGQVDQNKKLMQYMPFEILEYILHLQHRDIKQEDVYFLIKKDSRMDFNFLDKFIKNCKTVNIITNDLARFQKIQQDLYEQESIVLGVSNNKSKSLRKAKYIFNVNMNQKDLLKLKIQRNSIIIHMHPGVKYEENCFQGINVNKILITIPDEYVEKLDAINAIDGDKIDIEKFYESILLDKIEKEKNNSLVQTESYIRNTYFSLANDIIQKDEIKIRALVGNHGIISKNEIIENGKILYENDKKLYEKVECVN